MVEKDLTFCELLNGDIDILCGWVNFRNKSCAFVPAHFDLFIVLGYRLQTVSLSGPRFIVLLPIYFSTTRVPI
jgi:hypothetical protein